MSSEMIERIARAIARAEKWDDISDKTLSVYLPLARAAIEAMREPGLEIRKITTFEFAEVEWPKLIDAALSSPAEDMRK